jgi:hypothetical protein
MAQQTLFIRIHPRSKQEKNPPFRVQRYNIYGRLFEEAHGWYECSFSDEQWRYLRNVRQRSLDPHSMPVFDIVAKDPRPKAESIVEPTPAFVAPEIVEPAGAPESPDLTTADLRGDGTGKVVEKTEAERDERAAAYDAGEDIAPPASDPAPAQAKKRGRPKKTISATEG